MGNILLISVSIWLVKYLNIKVMLKNIDYSF